MKKIIHLSDLHLGGDRTDALFKEQCNRLKLIMQPASNYVILISGDIVDNANDEEQHDYAIKELTKLKNEGYTVLPVPGNHDYGNGNYAKKKYVDRFKKLFYNDEDLEYPKVDIVDNIAFIGIDSTAEEIGGLDGLLAQGEIGRKQLERLDNILSSEKVKFADYTVVYMHHHPFESKIGKKLKDSDDLKKVLEPHSVDALLFGHNHDGKVWNGVWGIKRSYDAGSSTGKRGGRMIHRVIDLSQPISADYDADL